MAQRGSLIAIAFLSSPLNGRTYLQGELLRLMHVSIFWSATFMPFPHARIFQLSSENTRGWRYEVVSPLPLSCESSHYDRTAMGSFDLAGGVMLSPFLLKALFRQNVVRPC